MPAADLTALSHGQEKRMETQYLIRGWNKQQKTAAHLWNGWDTACRMWSTGGLRNKKAYTVHPDTGGRRVCSMCRNVAKRQPQQEYQEPELELKSEQQDLFLEVLDSLSKDEKRGV